MIIYALNDNGLYYKTMIIANLALASSVNYDRKVCCKLKCTCTIVNYDPKPFIVQATDRVSLAFLVKDLKILSLILL
jgi:hypothetical protein